MFYTEAQRDANSLLHGNCIVLHLLAGCSIEVTWKRTLSLCQTTELISTEQEGRVPSPRSCGESSR